MTEAIYPQTKGWPARALAAALFALLALSFGCGGNAGGQRKAASAADSLKTALSDSLTRLDTLIARYPKNADLYYQRAKARFQIGDTLPAFEDAKTAVRFDEREPEYWYLRGMIRLALMQEDSAMFDLSTAANFGTANPDVYLQLGNLHTVRKEYEKARKWYEQGIRRGARPADYFAHAYLMRELKKPHEAEASLLQALNQDSTHAKSMALLFDLYLEDFKDEDKALAVNLKMLRRDSLDPVARFQSGYYFYSLFDRLRQSNPAEAKMALERSIYEYSMALKRDPEFARAWYQRGFSFLESGKTQNALNDFEQALNYHPNYAEAEFMLGSAYEKIGEKETALPHYRRALALKPGWKEAEAAVRELESGKRP